MLVDIIILATLILSMVLGYINGLFKSFIRLLFLLTPFILTLFFKDSILAQVDSLNIGEMPEPIPTIFVYIIFILLVSIVRCILKLLLISILHRNSFGSFDRIFGAIFGLAKGMLLVLLILLIVPPISILAGNEFFTSILTLIEESVIAQYLVEQNLFMIIFEKLYA